MKSFLIIGLGRFGTAVARELAELGQEVLVLDDNEENIQRIADDVTQAIVGDGSDESVLRSVGARNFDCCIVAVGSDLESSVLITVTLKDLGAKHIVAKAQNMVHAHVLERIGADRVILPESEMGQRLAQRLSRTNVVDFIGVSDEFSIVEIRPPKDWAGHSLGELNVRAKYSINVLAIRHDGKFDVTPSATQIIDAQDRMIVIGTNENVDRLVEQQ